MRPYDPDKGNNDETGAIDSSSGGGTTPEYSASSGMAGQGVDYAYNSSLDMADNIAVDAGVTPRVEVGAPAGDDFRAEAYPDRDVPAGGLGLGNADTGAATSSQVYRAVSQDAGDGDQSDAQEDGATGETEAIRSDIEQTRAQMSVTIDRIQERLSPQNLVDQAKGAVREATIGRVENVVNEVRDTARDAGSGFLDTIKENPLPAALAAVGIGWLWMKGRNNNQHNGRDYRYGGYDRGYSPDGAIYRYGSYGPAYGPGYGPGPGYSVAEMGYNPAYRGGGGPGEVIGRAGEKIGDVASNVGEAVGDAAGKAGSTIGDVASGAAGAVGSAAGAVGDAVGTAAGAVGDAAGNVVGGIGNAAGAVGSGVQYGAQRAQSQLQRMLYENPLAVGGAAMLIGAALGAMLPETEPEHRIMGEARDTVVEKAQTAAQQTMDKVGRVAEQVAGTVQDAASDVKDTAQQAAQDKGLTSSQM